MKNVVLLLSLCALMFVANAQTQSKTKSVATKPKPPIELGAGESMSMSNGTDWKAYQTPVNQKSWYVTRALWKSKTQVKDETKHDAHRIYVVTELEEDIFSYDPHLFYYDYAIKYSDAILFDSAAVAYGDLGGMFVEWGRYLVAKDTVGWDEFKAWSEDISFAKVPGANLFLTAFDQFLTVSKAAVPYTSAALSSDIDQKKSIPATYGFPDLAFFEKDSLKSYVCMLEDKKSILFCQFPGSHYSLSGTGTETVDVFTGVILTLKDRATMTFTVTGIFGSDDFINKQFGPGQISRYRRQITQSAIGDFAYYWNNASLKGLVHTKYQ